MISYPDYNENVAAPMTMVMTAKSCQEEDVSGTKWR